MAPDIGLHSTERTDFAKSMLPAAFTDGIEIAASFLGREITSASGWDAPVADKALSMGPCLQTDPLAVTPYLGPRSISLCRESSG